MYYTDKTRENKPDSIKYDAVSDNTKYFDDPNSHVQWGINKLYIDKSIEDIDKNRSNRLDFNMVIPLLGVLAAIYLLK